MIICNLPREQVIPTNGVPVQLQTYPLTNSKQAPLTQGLASHSSISKQNNKRKY